jgi:hypothetical protein
MEHSLINNVIQYFIPNTAGSSYYSPVVSSLYPCGKFITDIRATGFTGIAFRLMQDGRLVFPVRTQNIGNYLSLYFDSGIKYYELTGLYIPIKETSLLTLECTYVAAASFAVYVLVTMVSEDLRDILLKR